ncbi:SGNH/GDSL hydrolase family protein [Sphingomonas mollis]|uniref:SGNH/GDSL hydrolase family protein n=1 Tax=Sphingomonas mollis TaxID=2795726 RepID=UPI001E3F1F1F|nr:SGNH/GDSL hydrolase family protein [Sphingomonas sp. BT553]
MNARFAMVTFAGAALSLATPVAAQTYSNLFVFGDSLVDAGNAQAGRAASGGADPAPAAAGYYQGRFSNGYNFADYLSIAMGKGATVASAYGGLDFSVGGAKSAEVAGDASPSFAEQIDMFGMSGKTFDSNSLVLLTFGGNDVRDELAKLGTIAGYTPTLTPAVSAFNAGLQSLYAAGARNFVVTGLPDIGQIPAVTDFGSAGLSAAGTSLSFGLNNIFKQVIGGFDATPGVNATFFDLFAAQQAIYADPTAFGLPATLDTKTACLRTTAAPACNGYVYFDTIHPTTQLHAAIASGIVSQLGIAAVPEPATWTMLLTGFALTAGALRYRRRRTVLALAA